MRNLKKFLALVLAMMMVFSLMVTVNAASDSGDFAADVNPAYNEAVQVLNQLGIFVGDAGGFRPKSDITRAEVAAILCRATTGMVDAKDYEIYRDYPAFSDVTSDKWYAPYVNFASDKGLIYGYNGEFRPGDNVTGYEMLVMLLRAIGHEALGEYTGSLWFFRAASDAQKLGITRNIKDGTLGQDASRETVAEMLFRTIAKTYLMEYSEVTKGYVPRGTYSNIAGGTVTQTTLGYDIFGLYGGNIDNGVAKAPSFSTIKDRPELQYLSMTDRKGAVPAVANSYGEPVYTWYCNADKDVDDGDGSIYVYIAPTASYVGTVTQADLWADGIEDTIDGASVYTDGGVGTTVTNDITPNKNNGNPATDAVVKNGTLLDLYDTDDDGVLDWAVIKNIYTDTVNTNYVAGTKQAAANGKEFSLTNDSTDGAAGKFTDAEVAKYLSGLKKDDVVIYTKMSDDGTTAANVVDVSSIHLAKKTTVTITDTYTPSSSNADNSYFLVGAKKYEYNTQYGTAAKIPALSQPILVRDALVSGNKLNQVIYQDDNDYVVHTKDATNPGDTTTGTFLIVSVNAGTTSVGGSSFYRTFYAYNIEEGKWEYINGAVNASDDGYVYPSEDSGADFRLAVDIYTGVCLDGYWALTNDDTTNHSSGPADSYTTLSGTTVKNGNPVMLTATDASGGNLVDVVTNETVFVFATYNNNGTTVDRGYQVVKGVNNIGTLTEWATDAPNKNNTLVVTPVFAAHYIDLDADGLVDFVYISGAYRNTTGTLKANSIEDNLFYLVDDTPLAHANAVYDTHDVIVKGAKGTLTFPKGFVADTTGLSGLKPAAALTAGTFYNYESSATPGIDVGSVTATTTRVMVNATYKDGLVYSAIADGSTVATDLANYLNDGTVNSYLTLTDNCKVYFVSTSGIDTSKTLKDITGTQSVLVAATNEFGFATVIYVYTP